MEETKMTPAKSPAWFTRFAKFTAHQTGRPGTFVCAVLVIVVWAVTGPIFHWSDTWQLIVNTGTTIITFLMVFLIQSTQNRHGVAVQARRTTAHLSRRSQRAHGSRGARGGTAG